MKASPCTIHWGLLLVGIFAGHFLGTNLRQPIKTARGFLTAQMIAAKHALNLLKLQE